MTGALFMSSDGESGIWIEEGDFGHESLRKTALGGLSMDEAVQQYAEENPKMFISIEDHCPWDDVEITETWRI